MREFSLLSRLYHCRSSDKIGEAFQPKQDSLRPLQFEFRTCYELPDKSDYMSSLGNWAGRANRYKRTAAPYGLIKFQKMPVDGSIRQSMLFEVDRDIRSLILART